MLIPLRTPKEQVPAGIEGTDRTTFTCVTHSGYPVVQGNFTVELPCLTG
jgi:hypothetical protein